MQPPEIPEDEARRRAALCSLDLLDTPPDERFDRVTRIAQRLFDVPIALVSLVDAERQWFKSRRGLDATETPRAISFCGHAILGDGVFEVPDATADPRFHDNPLVLDAPGVRFYAGAPLHMGGGARIGTLCIIDRVPRDLDAEGRSLLRDLADVVQSELRALQLAVEDDLTGLRNRRGFLRDARASLAFTRRVGGGATCLFFDLNGFKQINDRFGHAVGDDALCDMARLMRETFRESDLVARLGGDEFCVLCPGLSEKDVFSATGRLDRRVASDPTVAERPYALRFSVGSVAYDSRRHASVEDLLAEADAAMYRNKTGRRLAPIRRAR